MISGDKSEIAEFVGNSVGINKVYAEKLPEEKLEILKEIKENSIGSTIYVGDGINDTPSIALADVGVAMGGLGSEVAIDCADVVIMDDDLRKLPTAIKQAKRIRKTVVMNIVFSLGVKFLVMLFSVITSIPVWVAMFGDVGVMLLAVLNSLTNSKCK
jgi:Cd2+/Zn2+-exporting ATPase